MKTAEQELMENINACHEPINSIKKVLPVPAGSNWAGEMKDLYDKLGTPDFGIVPGRAVFQHPMGPESGARCLRQGWEAIKQGIKIEEYAKEHVELCKSIEMFSKTKSTN